MVTEELKTKPGQLKATYYNPGFQVPIYAWTKGVPVEDSALAQAFALAKLPFVFHHIALMPDVHFGTGSTIGSVIATKDCVMPAAVGVDIGCGMSALYTSLKAKDLAYHDLNILRAKIEHVVPCGFSRGGKAGTWGDNVPQSVQQAWESLAPRYEKVCDDYPDVRHNKPLEQLGTLGSGNHFVEICLDTDDHVWIMLHSGSRGAGNRIGTQYTKAAQYLCERWKVNFLPHKDLAFLPVGDPMFTRYLKAVHWAQDYAMTSRDLMLRHVFQELESFAAMPLEILHEIRCHHNYLAIENHYGSNVYVTRKGAVRAREGDGIIIPGSMGAKSMIGEGLGNPESFHSCSHGAGRTMSRTQARKTITVEQHRAATAGIVCDKSADTIDETPSAYKDIDAVIAAQADLVKPATYLRQIICVKGKS